MPKKYIVLDTETTGLEVKQGHRIIEIGAVLVNNRIKSDQHFHSYLNPQRSIDEDNIYDFMNANLVIESRHIISGNARAEVLMRLEDMNWNWTVDGRPQNAKDRCRCVRELR